jgi:hypothetical protein
MQKSLNRQALYHTDIHSHEQPPTTAPVHIQGYQQKAAQENNRETPMHPKPKWYNNPPANMDYIHLYDSRDCRWCPKCGMEKGNEYVPT